MYAAAELGASDTAEEGNMLAVADGSSISDSEGCSEL